jgi:hypothetical protein
MSAISQIEFDSVSGKLTHVTLFDTVIHTASDLVGIGTFATILHR